MKTFLRYAITIAATTATVPMATAKAGPDVIKQQQQAKQLSFIENKGQITDQHGRHRGDIDYKLETPGMNFFLGDGQLHYQWQQQTSKQGDKTSYSTYRMDVVLLGANKTATAVAEEPQAYYEHYIVAGRDDGITSHTCNRITYKDIYPHIDWVIYSKNNQIKYDFVVRPGGDPKQIKLQYKGATALQLKEGALIATTPMGSITEEKPYSYQAGTNSTIASAYKLHDNILSFDLAAWTGTLVIDPTLEWATYYGGTASENIESASAIDVMGNVYLGGSTQSTGNIATTGAYVSSITSGQAGYIAKFNSAGIRQWATYYPGFWIGALCCDAAANIFAGGLGGGSVTTGAHQTTFGGGLHDGFIAKFSASGARLWASFYGGSGDDIIQRVACDPFGNVVFCGSTNSSNGIATTGSHQASIAGAYDAFFVKFSTSGVRQWGTYYGGLTDDINYAIACDVLGNVYGGGYTASSTGIATTGAHQTTLSGSHQGYFVKFNSSGVRQWASYYGAPIGSTIIYEIATDHNNNVYIGGVTTHVNNTSFSTVVATPGTHKDIKTIPGSSVVDWDGFVAKFDALGNRYWGTYYGGTGDDYVKGLAVDGAERVYLWGQTSSSTNPSDIATTGSHQSTYGGGINDGFLAQLDASGNRLWGTFFGGASEEYVFQSATNVLQGGNLAFNGAHLAFSGRTQSTSGIATSGAHQTTYQGSRDNFVAKIKADTMAYIPQPYTDTLFCPGATFSLAYTVTDNFRSGNTFTAQLSDASGDFSSPTNIGTVTSSTSGTISCTIPANAAAGSGYRVRVVSTAPARSSANNGVDIRVKPVPVPTAASNSPVCVGGTLNLTATAPAGSTYSWTGPNSFGPNSSQNPSISSITSAGTGNYIVTATLNGCSGKDTVSVSVTSLPATPLPFNNGPLCPGDMLSFGVSNPITGGAYNWTGPVSFTGTATPSVSSVAATHAGTYSVTVVANGCTSQPGTTTVVVKPLPATPVFTGSSSVCLGGTLTLDAASDPGSTYEWGGPNGFSSTLKNPSIAAVTKAAQGNYTVRATLNGCKSTTANSYVTVNIVANIGGYASPNDTICKGDTVTFVGFPQNGGPAPVFEWYRNGVVVTNNKIFNTGDVKTGDKFWCTMTAPNICGPIPVVISTDTIRMVVEGIQVTPVVKISASPAVTGDPAQSILFTATPQWGGTSPKYMWYKNGVATGNKLSTWSTSGIRIGDVISVEMESQHPCAAVTGAADTVAVRFPSSVKDQNNHSMSLYPNPNRGSFTIEGITAAQVQLSIINVLGQTVYTTTLQQVNGSMGIDTKLPIGAYLVRMQADGQSYTLRLNVAE